MMAGQRAYAVKGKWLWLVFVVLAFMLSLPVAGEAAKKESPLNPAISKYRSKRYKTAREMFNKVLASGTLSPVRIAVANIYLGHIERQYKLNETPHLNYEKALEFYEKAVEAAPNDLWVHYWKSFGLRELGRYDEALQSAENGLAIEPFYGGYFAKAQVYEEMGEYEAAIESIDKAIKLKGKPDYYLLRARNARFSGEYEQAFIDLEKAYLLGIDRASYRLERGEIFFVMGHHERGLGEFGFTDIKTGDKSFHAVHAAKAFYYLLDNQYEIADELFRQGQTYGQSLVDYNDAMPWISWLAVTLEEPNAKWMGKRKAAQNKGSWQLLMMEYFEGKADEGIVLELADTMPGPNGTFKDKWAIKYLVAQSRLKRGDKGGTVPLLQSIVQEADNRMLGTLATAKIRELKSMGPASAQPLPQHIAEEVPLYTTDKAEHAKYWEWVIEPVFNESIGYDMNPFFRGHLLSAKKGMRYALVKSDGTYVTDKGRQPFGVDDNGWVYKYLQNSAQYVNYKMEPILETKIKPYSPFNENGIRVVAKQGGPTLLVDKQDATIATFQGKKVAMLDEGMFLVREGKLYGIANEKGEMVTPIKYKGETNFSDGLCRVCVEPGKCTFIDKTGKERNPNVSFSESGSTAYYNGFTAIKPKREWLFMSKSGSQPAAMTFKEVQPYDSTGHARVQARNGKRGFIDAKGAWVDDPPPLSKPYDFGDLYMFTVEPRWGAKYSTMGLMDSRGNVVVPAGGVVGFKYSTRLPKKRGLYISMRGFNESQVRFLSQTPLIPARSSAKSPVWGYIRLK